MVIKPGSIITVVMETNPAEETTDLRTAIIYDIFDKKIIFSQTEPPIPASHLKKTISVSHLTRQRKGAVRQGFSAKIIEFIKAFQLSPGQQVPAIVVLPKTQSQEINFRACYRITPPCSSGLGLSLSWYPLNLLNISIGGAAFSHNYGFSLAPGMFINLILTIGGNEHEVEAVIRRISFPEDQHGVGGLKFISIEFSRISMQTKHALGKKLIDIQREIRVKTLGY